MSFVRNTNSSGQTYSVKVNNKGNAGYKKGASEAKGWVLPKKIVELFKRTLRTNGKREIEQVMHPHKKVNSWAVVKSTKTKVSKKLSSYVGTSSKLGYIHSIKDNICWVTRLDGCFMGEVVMFLPEGVNNKTVEGLILNIEEEFIKIVIIKGTQEGLQPGDEVYRTFEFAQAKAGFYVLGRIIDPLGVTLNKLDIDPMKYSFENMLSTCQVPLDIIAPGIVKRVSVRKPFLTGIASVDSFIPIGCGQRELIIGDNNAGKTSLAITALLNQRRFNRLALWRGIESVTERLTEDKSFFVPCIFVGIGKKRSEIARIRRLLILKDAFYYTSFVYASSDDIASIQYLAPYAGCAVGEWFMNRGYDALIIYDDLSEHAVAYRQMSLLLRRPPGREAYPGDVFYLHSRLLERSSQMSFVLGGGSLTALPIVETKGGDISAYIPTNIISITDGQLFLSKTLINEGIQPAIDLKLSVSRVGSDAQYSSMSVVFKRIKYIMSLYHTYASAAKLGAINSRLAVYINRGERIYQFYTQPVYETMTIDQVIIGLYTLSEGTLDELDLNQIYIYFKVMFDQNVYKEITPSHKLFFDFGSAVSFFMGVKFDSVEKIVSNYSTKYFSFFEKCIKTKVTTDFDYYDQLIEDLERWSS